MKKIFIAVLIFTLCLAGTGCDRFQFNNIHSAPEDVNYGNETEPQPYPIEIDGIEIKESPEKIICLSPSLTEILFEFGEGERVIGKSEYCDYPLAAKDIEVIQSGSNFDVEKIVRRSPNLLLLSSPIYDRDRVRLEREGISAVVIPAPRNIDEFRNVYRLIGLILYGAFTGEDDGEVVFSDIFSALSNNEGFNIGSFVYVTENMLIATGDTLESAVLSCFGDNLAAKGKGYDFDKSKLLETEPDIILLNSIYSIEDLSDDEELSQLDAVHNGLVILLDNSFFEKPSARITELIPFLQSSYLDLELPDDDDEE